MSSTPARESGRARRSAKAAEGELPKFRKCNVCEKRKPTEKFEKDNRAAGGRTFRCRACATAAQAGWRSEKPEKWKAAERKRIREAVRALRARRAKEGGRKVAKKA